ncbi:hypothetical protein ACVNIS_14820 [Sphaerotilaceae bacterium SBD11-9]
MKKSVQRRALGVLAVVLLTQALSACVVVPVPARRAYPVVVQPGYGPPPPYYDHRGRDWHR